MFPQCVHDFATSYGLTVSLLTGGLMGSVTHCAGMCGPFVLAQADGGPILQKASGSLLLPYHLGRMTTYVLLGVLVHSIVNLAFLFSGMKALIAAALLTMAGVLFLITAFPSLSAVFPWAGNIRFPAFFGTVAEQASSLMKNNHPAMKYLLGVLLGFMPCGLVVAALMAAATAPDAAMAATAMAAFSIGTMPSLIAIGLCGSTLKQKFPKISARFTQAALTISSVWLFTLAGILIF